ncbi:conserved hypothetical protein [Corynebacterium striatum]|nr:conserved hypothetical protein [Corynebacterium striatum]
MTDLSTSNLKRLLADAAPGPWEYVPGEAIDERCIVNLDTATPCIAIAANDEGSDCNDADLTLAALAPPLADEVLRMREALHDLSEVWEAISIGPYRTPAEQQLAAAVVDHIDQILGDHDG